MVPGKLSRNYVLTLGANAAKVFIAPNAIDNELFVQTLDRLLLQKTKLKAELGFESQTVILYVGQFIERKGLYHLLNAYAKIEKEFHNSALLFLGNGPMESDLRNIADSLQVQHFRIIHSGLNIEKLVMVYAVADIFVLPTLEDVWGFVINEAMICGLPVVSTRSSQAALEMVHSGENGYVVEAGDPEELYIALKNLISNPIERQRMGIRSNEVALNRFDVHHMAEGFSSAIKFSTKPTQK